MSGVDKGKYLTSILFVFAAGAVLNLALPAIEEQVSAHGKFNWFLLGIAISKNLTLSAQGLPKIWTALTSGGTFAAVYVWLFDKFLWKIPLLQGWLVRFPNLQGTWVGVITPRTKGMTSSAAAIETGDRQDIPKVLMPQWAIKKGVVPVYVTIKHSFDKLTFTAVHPNSENETLAYQLVNLEQAEKTMLYVVYENNPYDRTVEHAAAHKGCCGLKLSNNEGTKTAGPNWKLEGTYWTDKIRKKPDENDRGTWGDFRVHFESRKLGEKPIDFIQERFDV